MARVFVSHSHEDAEVVRGAILPALRQAGIPYFCTSEGTGPHAGQDVGTVLNDALDAMEWFVVVVSKSSARSDYVKGEVATAFERIKDCIIPVLVDDTPARRLAVRLATKFYVDWSQPGAAEKLVQALPGTLTAPPAAANSGGMSVPPPPPPAQAAWHVAQVPDVDWTQQWSFADAVELIKAHQLNRPQVMKSDPSGHAQGWQPWDEVIAFRVAIETSMAPAPGPPPPPSPTQVPAPESGAVDEPAPAIPAHLLERLAQGSKAFVIVFSNHFARWYFEHLEDPLQAFWRAEELPEALAALETLRDDYEVWIEETNLLERFLRGAACCCLGWADELGEPEDWSEEELELPEPFESELSALEERLANQCIGLSNPIGKVSRRLEKVSAEFDDNSGAAGGGLLGAGIGFALAGPLGAAIGGALGGGSGSAFDGGVDEKTWKRLLKAVKKLEMEVDEGKEWVERKAIELLDAVCAHRQAEIVASGDRASLMSSLAFFEAE